MKTLKTRINYKHPLYLMAVALLILMLAVGCGQTDGEEPAPNQEPQELKLATTTSTYDSGLLDEFLPVFEEQYNYEVSVVSQGTGAALETGKRGDADVVLVHAKDQELQLVEEGFLVDRHDVMYNDFIIVGPAEDRAGIKGGSDAAVALTAIADNQAVFVSRGDESGTHVKELSLWDQAGIESSGDWYRSVGQGMGDVLRMASERQGYTMTDRGTYIALRDNLELEILVEGDEVLFNQYGIMAPNPDQHAIDYEGATALIEFFISDEGQALIADFQKDGEQLFYPNAE